MKTLSTIILALMPFLFMPGITSAAPVTTWTGPGPRACMGRCSVDWAMSQLNAERRAAVEAAMESDPLGYSIPVQDGATFVMMSYFDQEAKADMRTTIASLELAEPANGWQFDGWSFVQIAGCQNWAVLTDNAPVSADLGPASGTGPLGSALSPLEVASAGPLPGLSVGTSAATTTPTAPTTAALTSSGTTSPTPTTPTTTDPSTTDPTDLTGSSDEIDLPGEDPVLVSSDDPTDPGTPGDQDSSEVDETKGEPTPPFDIAEVTPRPMPPTSVVTPTEVPLPSTISLLLLSLIGFGLWRKPVRGRV